MTKDVKCLQREILNAVGAKKTSIRRKWMELNSLANAHQLILLPYQAQLGYMSQVVEERRNLLLEIQAEQLQEHKDHHEEISETSVEPSHESSSSHGSPDSGQGATSSATASES